MKQKKLKITLEDFILANRKAARMEEDKSFLKLQIETIFNHYNNIS